VQAELRVAVVLDPDFLMHCVRHLLIAGATLAETCDGSRALHLQARVAGPDVVIDVRGCRVESVPDAIELPVDGGAAVAGPSSAGLHLALADELARAMGGALEAFRSPDDAYWFRVRVRRADVVEGPSLA
jgi:hypothetical protein